MSENEHWATLHHHKWRPTAGTVAFCLYAFFQQEFMTIVPSNHESQVWVSLECESAGELSAFTYHSDGAGPRHSCLRSHYHHHRPNCLRCTCRYHTGTDWLHSWSQNALAREELSWKVWDGDFVASSKDSWCQGEAYSRTHQKWNLRALRTFELILQMILWMW